MNTDTSSHTTKLLLTIFLIAGSSNLLSGCMGEKANAESETVEEKELVRPARIAEVTGFKGSSIRTFPAIIDANKKTDLAFRIPGQLTKLPAKAGKRIKKGQLLARIDSTDYKNTLEDRLAKFSLAKTQHKQTITLFKKKYASQAEVDSVNAQLRAAQVAVQQAKTNVGYTNLHAPFSGVIGHVNVENHQNVQAQQTIAQLQNTNQLDVKFDVPESLVKSLRKSEAYRSLCGKVNISSEANGKKSFKACYKQHDSVPDEQTRTYPVLFSLKNPAKANVIPGMSVDLVIDLSSLIPAGNLKGNLVPVESVFDENDKQWVWKLDKDLRTVKTPVTVAGIKKGMVRITEGLETGDKVISAGVSHLVEGQKVRPFVKERGL